MTQYSGVYTLQQQGQALTSGQWATEPYFKNTTLLLHADGVAGGAQNNTFLDSSTNAFAITRNGNTTQGTFTPYGPTWSNYFNGSDAYLTYPNSSAFAFGTGAFTIEFWINGPSNNDKFILSGRNAVGTMHITTGGYTGSASALRYVGSSDIVTTVLVTNNVWNHCAIVRDGSNNITLYVNGVSAATGTDTTNYTTTTGTWYMCRNDAGAAGYLTANVSNLRITKGAALYTSSFTPSTTPLTTTVSAGTVSLLTSQSNRFVDNSSSPVTLTVNGTPSVQRFSPFAPQYQYTPAVIGGSGYFDGTTDFLTVPKNTSLEPATNGSWCLETWVYAASNTAGIMQVVAYANASVGSGSDLGYFITHYPGNYINGGFYSGGSQYAITSASSFATINEWQHVALTSDGTTMRLFINGVSVGTPVTVTGVSINAPSSALFKVGNYSSSQYLVGYTSDTRFVKGSAVYTTTFTPPTAPLTAISNTSLLMNYTNAGIYDNAMMNNLETVGHAQVSTSVFKYGSGSLYFDGNGDYLYIPNNLNFRLPTGDFTIEGWVYVNSFSATYTPLVIYGADNVTSGTQLEYWIGFNSANKLQFSTYVSSTQTVIYSGSAMTTGTWVHFACVRAGSAQLLFANGVLQSSTTQSGSLNDGTTSPLKIGSYTESGTSYYLNGYIDDLRITKGVARYTSNFVPPKVAFSNQ